MALTDDDPIDPYADDPYVQWARSQLPAQYPITPAPQELSSSDEPARAVKTTMGPRGRHTIGKAGEPVRDEQPGNGIDASQIEMDPPDNGIDPSQIEIDPKPTQLGEFPPEYAGKGPPNLGEFPPEQVGTPAPYRGPDVLGAVANYIAPGSAQFIPGTQPGTVLDYAPNNTNEATPGMAAQAPPMPGDPNNPLAYPDWAGQQYAQQRAAGTVGAPNVNAGEQGQGATALPSTAENDLEAAKQKEIAAIHAMSPEQYQQYVINRGTAITQRAIQQKQEIDRRNWDAQQRDMQYRQQSLIAAQQRSRELSARAERLAGERVVAPSAGPADVFGIILGNMFSNGGPNMALAQFNKKVENSIAVQQANISNGWKGIDAARTAIGDEMAQGASLYEASQTYRLAAYTQQINDMQSDLQQYDPAGQTAIALREGISQFEVARQQTQAAMDKALAENEYTKAKTLGEYANAAKTVTETEGIAGKNARAGMGPATKPEDVAYPVAKWIAWYPELQKILPAGVQQLSKSELDNFIKQHGEISAANKSAIEEQATDTDTSVNLPHGDHAPIKDERGNVIRVEAGQAKELNTGNAAAQTVVSALNDVDRMLEEGPSAFNRTRFAEIQARADWALPYMAKMFDAKFSSKEEKALLDITGVDFKGYVSRFKDIGTARAKLRQIVNVIKEERNRSTSTALHRNVDNVIADTSLLPPAEKTPVDKLAESLATPQASGGDSGIAALDRASKVEPGATGIDTLNNVSAAYFNPPEEAAKANPDDAAITAKMGQLRRFALSRVNYEKDRYYLVDEDGNEIEGVKPVDKESEAGSLLKLKSDARAVLSDFSVNAEDKRVRDPANQAVLFWTQHEQKASAP